MTLPKPPHGCGNGRLAVGGSDHAAQAATCDLGVKTNANRNSPPTLPHPAGGNFGSAICRFGGVLTSQQNLPEVKTGHSHPAAFRTLLMTANPMV